VCEQLAGGCCLKVAWSEVELATFEFKSKTTTLPLAGLMTA